MYDIHDEEYIADDLTAFLADDYLEHYGTPRHSGRYPWGSGKDPQRNRDLISRAQNMGLKYKGGTSGGKGIVQLDEEKYKELYADKKLTQKQIAEQLGYETTTQLRAAITEANKARTLREAQQIAHLRDDQGLGWTEIGRRLGNMSESSVRSKYDAFKKGKTTQLDSTIDILRKAVNEGKRLDVGAGTELYLGVGQQNLKTALEVLRREGYFVDNVKYKQLGTGKETTTLVLAPKDTTKWDLKREPGTVEPVASIGEYVDSNTDKPKKLHDPTVVSSKQLQVVYAEDGGKDKDGVIELRRGVPELSLGDNHYAQVRINVDGTHYLKGMAMYADDLPEGVNIRFNTNKTKDIPVLGPDKNHTVLKMVDTKAMKEDPLAQFGALIDRQNDWTDNKGEHKGALNIVRGEGEWSEWSKSIASQMLSKQPDRLARQQLNLAYKQREDAYNEIMSLTNNTLKKELLLSFADECDGAATHLKAAAFPRQAYHVLLPVPELKPTEIYAPNYEDGERVVLIRYPHGGRFEIPELIVNNNNKKAKSLLGNAKDAVGIHPFVAEQLAGADFDGDTALVIPNNKGDIKTMKVIPELQNFDAKVVYKKSDDQTPTKGHFNTGLEMGKITNLITDMTQARAPIDEIVRATKHSQVVIDAEKHNLDARASELDNGIQELRNKYQPKEDGRPGGGASTLLSKATAEVRVPERTTARTLKDPETGEYIIKDGIEVATGRKVYTETNREYTPYKRDKETGEWIPGKKTVAQSKISGMESVDDARELMSGPNHEGTNMERIYADYANRCKALANTARKEYLATSDIKRDANAARNYANEVTSLKVKLTNAKKNAPLERYAQRKAADYMKMVLEEDPSIRENKGDYKKEKGKALQRARRDIGAKKPMIEITDSEWEAIQNGAVSATMLKDIIKNTDQDELKKRALPKPGVTLSAATKSRIRAYADKGLTQAEIAKALGISTSTVFNVLDE